MLLQTHLEIPARLLAGLASGDYVRRGGVIQHARGVNKGEIVGWLREASPLPMSPADLIRGVAAPVAQALQLAGSVASVINLAATVGFGVATLHKLGKVDQKIEKLLDGQGAVLRSTTELQQTVDVGFKAMILGFQALVAEQARLSSLIDEKFQHQVMAKMRSAMDDLASANALPADSPQRVQRLEHVLARIGEAYQNLSLDAHQRAGVVTKTLRDTTERLGKLNTAADDVVTLVRLRLAASAAAQRAKVLAEAGQPEFAARFLSQAADELSTIETDLGKALFVENGRIYDHLLNRFWKRKGVTPGRIGNWATHYDVDVRDLEGVLNYLQDLAEGEPSRAETSAMSKLVPKLASQNRLTAIDAQVAWNQPNADRFLALVRELDGLHEDVDRLHGHAAEYAYMAQARISPHDLAERLRIADLGPEALSLVFIEAEAEVEAAVAADHPAERV